MPDNSADALPSDEGPAPRPSTDSPRPRRNASPASRSQTGRPQGRPRKPRSRNPKATGPAPVAPAVEPGPRSATDPSELPDPPGEGRASPAAAAQALVRKPRIGDTRPAPPPPGAGGGEPASPEGSDGANGDRRRRRRRGGRGRAGGRTDGSAGEASSVEDLDDSEFDDGAMERRRGRERKGRPAGRYFMCVHTAGETTQIAIMEGRSLTEHFVSRTTNDDTEIHGNIYLGRVQNVLPGMEAAFVDIGTPKNAVLYRGDVQYEPEDIEEKGAPRIEQMLKAGQYVLCQVTKNPIGAKGARLTQEVSLAGRFVVLVPNSSTYGISKRLADDERRRLRRILDEIRPGEHGLIVRTAAEGATATELRRDVERLLDQWGRITAQTKGSGGPRLLYREPALPQRVIREEFNRDYRGVLIDDPELFAEIRSYVEALIPELADRVQFYRDPDLPLFERHHVHEQLHKAIDRKVWLPSGGSLIIERTEALTVIDVNTGKNVGSSNLEATVFANNLEAASEIARQLRLRDIGGIIVIDFIDMEVKANREKLIGHFRDALARDKTRTQVFDISELGLVEMTRKRVSEGLVESFSETCPTCAGRGLVFPNGLG